MNSAVSLMKQSLGKHLEILCKYPFIVFKGEAGCVHWVRQFAIVLQKLTTNWVHLEKYFLDISPNVFFVHKNLLNKSQV